MKKLVLTTFFVLGSTIASAEEAKPSVRIQDIMMIKECLTNKSASACLSGKDIHIIQRILSQYVIAQASRHHGG